MKEMPRFPKKKLLTVPLIQSVQQMLLEAFSHLLSLTLSQMYRPDCMAHTTEVLKLLLWLEIKHSLIILFPMTQYTLIISSKQDTRFKMFYMPFLKTFLYIELLSNYFYRISVDLFIKPKPGKITLDDAVFWSKLTLGFLFN